MTSNKTLSDYRRNLAPLIKQREAETQMLKASKLELERGMFTAANTAEAQKVLQTVAQYTQQQVHQKLASIVSKCLALVFDDPYEFRLVFEQKRGKTEARLVFYRNGYEVDPKTAAGGGVLDVASFALRLACLSLEYPKPRLLMVMDEQFKFLHSTVSQERVKQMLLVLSEDLGMQFIMSTGEGELQVGSVISLPLEQ